MSWRHTPYPVALLLAGLMLVLLALYAWRRRSVPGATALALLTAAAAWWALAYALSLNATDAPTKYFWGDAKYLGIVSVAPAWLAFALQYTGWGRRLTTRTWTLLAALPLATLLVIFTNGYHGLFWRSRVLSAPGSFPTIEPVYGPWFWVHLAYSYALVLLGTALLFRALFSSPLYRGQRIALLVGACVPWAGNAVNVSGLVPAAYPDPAPFAFAVSGAAFAWGLSRRGLLDIVPVARDAVFEGMEDGVVVLDAQNRVVDLNPAAERALDLTASEAVGQSVAGVLPDHVVRLLEEHRGEEGLRREARFGEDARDYELVLSPLRGSRGRLQAGRLVVLRDVTERKVLQERLKRQALHDPLTGLPNRRLFFDRLEHALARSSGARAGEGRDGAVAVVFLDLDGLKVVNDSWGHEAGDRLLIDAARRIEACGRPGDTVARLGGDEFAILIEDVERAGDAEEAARRVGEALRAPIALAGRETSVAASVGVAAAYPGRGPATDRAADLLRQADAAMYAAKREGKGRCSRSDDAGIGEP